MPTGEDDEELVGELVGKLELLGDGVSCSTQSDELNDWSIAEHVGSISRTNKATDIDGEDLT